jgi:dihydropteroate synthase
MKWTVRDRVLSVDRPLIMGILNVTPDSFSDGGRFLSVAAAVEHGLKMLDEGADLIDVGGESTRPQGATAVSVDEELRRVLPVVETLSREQPTATISIDTVKSDVARAALGAGAHIVNDVSALRLDAGMLAVCAESRAGVVLMHSRGGVSDMGTYAHANYDDVVGEVLGELQNTVRKAREGGVSATAIAVDPGFGFAKRTNDTLRMLAALPKLSEWGLPIVVGVSRKRFIGEITGVRDAAGRLNGTLGANVAALALGARIFRVHDVRPHREALDVAWEILGTKSNS